MCALFLSLLLSIPWCVHIRLSFLDRGMVYAIAHIRGGGEMGRPWYEDSGKYLTKRNTFQGTKVLLLLAVRELQLCTLFSLTYSDPNETPSKVLLLL